MSASSQQAQGLVLSWCLLSCKSCSSWLCGVTWPEARASFCVSCCCHLQRTVISELCRDTISPPLWKGVVLCSANHFRLAEHKRYVCPLCCFPLPSHWKSRGSDSTMMNCLALPAAISCSNSCFCSLGKSW